MISVGLQTLQKNSSGFPPDTDLDLWPSVCCFKGHPEKSTMAKNKVSVVLRPPLTFLRADNTIEAEDKPPWLGHESLPPCICLSVCLLIIKHFITHNQLWYALLKWLVLWPHLKVSTVLRWSGRWAVWSLFCDLEVDRWERMGKLQEILQTWGSSTETSVGKMGDLT